MATSQTPTSSSQSSQSRSTKAKPKLYRFRLIRGQHIDSEVVNGEKRRKLYNRGDVIETEMRLDRMFGNEKFERLHDDED